MEAQDLGISDSVEFHLDVSSDELRDKLQTLDVFVVPSHQEGLCISALEAMACGCPVVSTRCGGPEEFVIDGETGYLVGSSPSEISDAVLSIISSPKVRQDIGKAARDTVKQCYLWGRANEVFWAPFEENF